MPLRLGRNVGLRLPLRDVVRVGDQDWEGVGVGGVGDGLAEVVTVGVMDRVGDDERVTLRE